MNESGRRGKWVPGGVADRSQREKLQRLQGSSTSRWPVPDRTPIAPRSHDSALHWRHNDHDGISNHQPHGCLFNRLFRRRSKKASKLRVSGLCVGNSPGPVNSPHKGPVTRKMFPFDDVIMDSYTPRQTSFEKSPSNQFEFCFHKFNIRPGLRDLIGTQHTVRLWFVCQSKNIIITINKFLNIFYHIVIALFRAYLVLEIEAHHIMLSQNKASKKISSLHAHMWRACG